MHKLIYILLALVCLCLTGVARAADTVLNVYVTAATPEPRKKVDDATKKELEQRADAAKQARKAVEKQLKDQYGKKEEAWPKEKQDAFFDAEEAEALAVADYDYRRVDPEGLSDSAQDLKDSLSGKGLQTHKDNVHLVDSAADADLIIEVVARRSTKTLPTQVRADNYYISFVIKPGGKESADQFAKVPHDYRFRRFGYQVWRLQAPRPDAPIWRFDAYGQTRWANAAAAGAVMINDFVEKNYAALTGRMSP